MAHAFERLMKIVRTQLPGAVDDAIRLELFNVLNMFLRDTGAWREDIPVALVAGVTDYAVTPESTNAALIVRLQSVTDDVTNVRVPMTMSEPGELVAVTEPSTSQNVTATVVLTVGDPQTSDGYPFVPEWIVQQYYTALAAGVVGAMMASPAKPYTNERLAILNTRRFNTAKAMARVGTLHDNLQSAQAWRFPQFA
jgi:hypothetical protein